MPAERVWLERKSTASKIKMRVWEQQNPSHTRIDVPKRNFSVYGYRICTINKIHYYIANPYNERCFLSGKYFEYVYIPLWKFDRNEVRNHYVPLKERQSHFA